MCALRCQDAPLLLPRVDPLLLPAVPAFLHAIRRESLKGGFDEILSGQNVEF